MSVPESKISERKGSESGLQPKATESNCTVGLLLHAAHCSSRIKVKPDYLSEPEAIQGVSSHGYTIGKSVSPNATKPEEKGPTRLSAVCLEPNDPQSPIIISFGGTKKPIDWLTNLRLGLRGEIGKETREAAFAFYKQVRANHPGKEIIVAGHSLGGHIAQYVGTRAYVTDEIDLNSKRLVQVRTFNTAPIGTDYSKVLKDNPGLNAQMVNYRFENDTTSNLGIHKYLGNTFVFPCPVFWAHLIQNLKDHLSPEIQKLKVGSSTGETMNQNILIEQISGVLNSYQCRVNGQYFSSLRAGTKNLEYMQLFLPTVSKLVRGGDYGQALGILEQLKDKMNGSASKGIIETLIKSTQVVQQAKMKQEMVTHRAPPDELPSPSAN